MAAYVKRRMRGEGSVSSILSLTFSTFLLSPFLSVPLKDANEENFHI
ncbi:hypothetical protein V6Z12_A05G372600 [Gossypium hirsutum]